MNNPNQKKRGRGRPKREFTPEEVTLIENMCSVGVTQDQIAKIMGCSIDVLHKRLSDVMENARAKAVATVTKSLYQHAIEGSLGHAIFWMKNVAGWRDKPEDRADEDLSASGVITDKPMSIDDWNKKYALPQTVEADEE